MPLSVTPLYAGLLGLFYAYISLRIPRLRMRHRVALGHGNISQLERAVRIHGNFSEYVPFALLLLALVEWSGYSTWFVHVLGMTLLVARGLHAYGLHRHAGASPGRFMGTLLTLAFLAFSSILVLMHTIGGYFK